MYPVHSPMLSRIQKGKFLHILIRRDVRDSLLLSWLGFPLWNETGQAICAVSLDKFHLLIIVQKILGIHLKRKEVTISKYLVF